MVLAPQEFEDQILTVSKDEKVLKHILQTSPLGPSEGLWL